MLACSLLAWCTWASNFSLLSYVLEYCARVLLVAFGVKLIMAGVVHLLQLPRAVCWIPPWFVHTPCVCVCAHVCVCVCACVCVCVCAARVVWQSAAMEKIHTKRRTAHLHQFCRHFIFLSADLCHSTPHFLPRLLQLCRSELIHPLQLDYMSLCWQPGSVRWRWSGDWGGGGGQDSTGVGDEGVDCGHSLHIPSSLERNKQQFS